MFLEEIQLFESEGLISDKSRIMFVNNGSKDKTWAMIKFLSTENEYYMLSALAEIVAIRMLCCSG